MEIKPLKLLGTYEIILAPRLDTRGYFMRTYDEAIFREHGLQTQWVQENQSKSATKFTLRGLHYQRPPHAETKLIRVVTGAILDIFVDLRAESPTYGQWDSLHLSVDGYNMVYIPKGFAHGFCTLTSDTTIFYKVDSFYTPDYEGGLRWNDPVLNIQWPTDNPFISDRDKLHPNFGSVVL